MRLVKGAGTVGTASAICPARASATCATATTLSALKVPWTLECLRFRHFGFGSFWVERKGDYASALKKSFFRYEYYMLLRSY